MGKKKNKKYKDLLKQEIRELQLEEQRLHKKRRAIMASCQHREGKEFTIEYEKKGRVRCRQCGSRFSLETFVLDDIRDAAQMLNSALQQVRILADPHEDAKQISDLGKLGADITSVHEIYRRHLERYSKNNDNHHKKKKKDSYDDFGGYNGVIEIMEGAIPKKKKRRK